jgi:hypothetical protein
MVVRWRQGFNRGLVTDAAGVTCVYQTIGASRQRTRLR